MSDRFVLGAYWGARKESAKTCAGRALHCLEGLAEIDPVLFGQWFELGRSRKDALNRKVRPELEQLQALLEKGRNRRDSDRSIIEELGFSLSSWNGRSHAESVGIDFHCGAWSSRVGNSCVIKLPYGTSAALHTLTAPVLAALLAIVVNAWNPSWGMVISDEHRDLIPEPPPGAPIVGWLTYLSAARGATPSLPAPATIIPVQAKGSIIVTVPKLFVAANPMHVATAGAVADRLREAGLLRPNSC